jgi:hypothetical protein
MFAMGHKKAIESIYFAAAGIKKPGKPGKGYYGG